MTAPSPLHLLFLFIHAACQGDSFYEECGCRAVPRESACPLGSKCVNDLLVESDCSVSCEGEGAHFAFRSGTPWRFSSHLTCVGNGRYQAATGSPFTLPVSHLACVGPKETTECKSCPVPPAGFSGCPPGGVCQSSSLSVILSPKTNCAALTCSWGELIMVTGRRSFSGVGQLSCNSHDVWVDRHGNPFEDISRLTCMRNKGCDSCVLPSALEECSEWEECEESLRLVHLELAKETGTGCALARCSDPDAYIIARNATAPVVFGVPFLRCDARGRWHNDVFSVMGEDIQASCYLPKCRRCTLRELKECSDGFACDQSLIDEPNGGQECFETHCGSDSQMLVVDDSGKTRVAARIHCAPSGTWLVIEADTGDEILLEDSQAAVTCRRNPPDCATCDKNIRTLPCPANATCSKMSRKGGLRAGTNGTCLTLACPAGTELMVSMHGGKMTVLAQSGFVCIGSSRWMAADNSTTVDFAAGDAVTCRHIVCDSCPAFETTGVCSVRLRPKGCDQQAAQKAAQVDASSGCRAMQCPNGGKLAFFSNDDNGQFLGKVDGLMCKDGSWMSESGFEVPTEGLAVTCVEWFSDFKHCGSDGCTFVMEEEEAQMRHSDRDGCYELFCPRGDIYGYHAPSDRYVAAKQGYFGCGLLGWHSAYGLSNEETFVFGYHIRVRCSPRSFSIKKHGHGSGKHDEEGRGRGGEELANSLANFKRTRVHSHSGKDESPAKTSLRSEEEGEEEGVTDTPFLRNSTIDPKLGGGTIVDIDDLDGNGAIISSAENAMIPVNGSGIAVSQLSNVSTNLENVLLPNKNGSIAEPHPTTTISPSTNQRFTGNPSNEMTNSIHNINGSILLDGSTATANQKLAGSSSVLANSPLNNNGSIQLREPTVTKVDLEYPDDSELEAIPKHRTTVPPATENITKKNETSEMKLTEPQASNHLHEGQATVKTPSEMTKAPLEETTETALAPSTARPKTPLLATPQGSSSSSFTDFEFFFDEDAGALSIVQDEMPPPRPATIIN